MSDEDDTGGSMSVSTERDEVLLTFADSITAHLSPDVAVELAASLIRAAKRAASAKQPDRSKMS